MTGVQTCALPISNDKVYFILTGSVNDWLQALESCCKEKVSYVIRKIFNAVYFFFGKTALSELLIKFKKIDLSDSSFIVRYK